MVEYSEGEDGDVSIVPETNANNNCRMKAGIETCDGSVRKKGDEEQDQQWRRHGDMHVSRKHSRDRFWRDNSGQ